MDTDEEKTGAPTLEDQAQDRDICGFMIKVQPAPFDKSWPGLLRLLRLVSAPAADALRAGASLHKMAAIVDHIPTILTDAETTYFMELFGPYSWIIEGDRQVPLIKANRNKYFAVNHLACLRWILFAMEVNFTNFFGGIQSDAGNIGAVMDLLNLKTSTGGSGSAGVSSPTSL